jgi:hypothetical protein
MTHVILPRRRAYQAAFWIVACATIALVTAFAASAAGGSPRWALASAALVLLPGIVWRPWFRLGVGAWNRAVRLLFVRLRVAAAWISFHLLFPLLRRSGTRVQLTSPAQLTPAGLATLWSARDGAGADARGEGWLTDLVVHARRTGNWWLLALVPFIFTLMLLATEVEETAPGGSTYTLY